MFSTADGLTPQVGALARQRVRAAGPPSRSSRIAVSGLIAVVLTMSGFALWASQSTAKAASHASAANRLAGYYLEASQAASEEKSLERSYRLNATPETRAAHTDAERALIAALNRVKAEGTAADRAQAQAILLTHDDFRATAAKMFAAVDRGDLALAGRIEYGQAEPLFRLQHAVDEAAAGHRKAALRELAAMRRVSDTMTWGVPLVFLIGLAIALALSTILRRYRRDLDAERAQAVHDSSHDSLTGLANRQLLATRLHNAVQRGERVGLVLLDLDRFKEINDTLGHRCGDELLTHVGPRLTATVRETDTVARLGGDEFAVLLPDVTNLDAVLGVVEKLRLAIEKPIQIAGADLSVEASVGVVVSGEHGDDAQTLLRRAEVAMYVAKARNRGVAVYDPSEDAHDPDRLALLTELRRAMDQRELVLHYQPKISLASGEVCGVEALVRWEHPQRGMVPPDKFIPLAEHTGLIGPLTRYVLDLALSQAHRWADMGHPLQIAVNLAARNLADPDLADDVLTMLETHQVPAHLLCLELTESAITTEPENALRLLTRLRAAGVSLAVDDFGTGYTSLGQLKNLPITELKIDRSFVGTMTTERSNGLIVRSIVDLARNLGLTTVAEGVEDAETFTALASNGCAVAQGYHMSRPLPPNAFDRWYADTRAVYDVA
ncbi:EAL domain-containing protein [Planosporangium flavigriseum]|uniref:putative bifunctional diguanylate cyclase/phosphodiesterase n=1 Tax=Planosporangium flavigriseum TaxID=373681 RepID=UPI00143928CF|nr:EAL domain-containing protein [Planosporangium flavigriseum]NJC65433.1 EAL domain-containing protein [Planosporangium flavigriseum]